MTRGRSARRHSRWLETHFDEALTNLNTSETSLMVDLGDEDIAGLTIIRTLIDLTVGRNVVGSTFGAQEVFIGMGVVQLDAFIAGSVPDVQTEGDRPVLPWMLRASQTIHQGAENTIPLRFEYDLRGARKLATGGALAFLALRSELVVGTSFVARINGWVRMLVKLP